MRKSEQGQLDAVSSYDGTIQGLGLYWDSIGIVENKMETSIMGDLAHRLTIAEECGVTLVWLLPGG